MTDTAAFTLSIAGTVTTWSPAVRATFGYEPQEFIGKPFEELFAAPEGVDAAAPLDAARVGGHAPLSGWRVGKSGRPTMVRGHVSLLHSERGEPAGFAVVMQPIPSHGDDVSGTAPVEAVGGMVAEAVAAMPDVLYVLDHDLRYRYINPACERYWAVSAEDVIGRRVIDVFPRMQDSEFWQRHLDTVTDRRRHRFEAVSPIRGRTVEALLLPIEGGMAGVIRDPLDLTMMSDDHRAGLPFSATEVSVCRYVPSTGEVTVVGNQSSTFGFCELGPFTTHSEKLDLVLPADRKAYEHAVATAVQRAEPWQAEYRIRRPRDGATIWLAEHGTVEDAEGELAYVVMTWDVTALRRVEEQLRTGQRRLRRELLVNRLVYEVLEQAGAAKDPRKGVELLVEAAVELIGGARGGVWLLDRASGRVRVYAQRGFAGAYLSEFGEGPADVEALDEAAYGGIVTRDIPDDEMAALREDGAKLDASRCIYVPLRGASGRSLGTLCIHIAREDHVSERDAYALKLIAMQVSAHVERFQLEEESGELVRRMEEHAKVAGDALLESELRFRRAFELGPVAAVITTRDEDRFLEVNDHYVKLTGYDRDEVVGRTARELGMWSSPEDRQKLDAALKAGGAFRELEVRLRTRDGQIRDILLSGEEIEYAGHRCMLKMFNDVTEHHRSQEELMSAIREVMSDAEWFSQSVVQRLAQIRHESPEDVEEMDLTPREREVLEFVAAGLSDDEVAERLGISQRTARNHLTNTYAKIGAHNRSEAIVWARERGLVARLN